MTLKTAKLIVRCLPPHRKDAPDREQQAALKAVSKSSDLTAAMEYQVKADEIVAEKINIEPSSEWVEAVGNLTEKLRMPAKRSHLSVREPAFLALVLAFIAMVAVGIWLILAQSDQFPGMDETKALAIKGDASQQAEFEPLDTAAGDLGDWFLIQGFDGFAIPKAFAEFNVVGVRVFEFEDIQVAMMVVPENRAFFYVFPARKLGIEPGAAGTWRILEYVASGADRSLGISQSGDFCFMITFEGSDADMEQFIRKAETR